MPVIILMHGGQSTGRVMEKVSGMSRLVDQKGFMAVYPDAIGVYKGKLYWNDGRLPEVDDVGFIAALIDELVAKFKADPARVYVTGISNGASMTNVLGIKLSHKIAAIAPVAGTFAASQADVWKPTRPMPVLYFHSPQDKFAFYSGGSVGTRVGSSLPAEDYLRWWSAKNGCQGEPITETLPDKAQDGTIVDKVVFPCPNSKAEVVFYRINNGGHTWPGRTGAFSEKVFGKTTGNVDANLAMWEFFQRFKRESN